MSNTDKALQACRDHRSVIVTPARCLITGYRPQGEDWLYRAYMDHHPDAAKPFPKRTLTHLAVLGTLGVPPETTAVVLS